MSLKSIVTVPVGSSRIQRLSPQATKMPWHNTGERAARQPGSVKTGPSPLARRQLRRPNAGVIPLCATMGFVIEVEPDRFEEMVITALDGLPDDLGRLMRNVAVTVEHDAGPPGLLGLYQGVPLTSRTTHYAGGLPDRITIYRVAICRICRTEDEVIDQVGRTVIHEVGHHFGIDDDKLRELGW